MYILTAYFYFMLRIAILFLIVLSFLQSPAQNTIGLPEITNYSRNMFRGGMQTWCIRQDQRGIIYCANNEGLLVFDGSHWKKYVLPNETIIRAMEIKDEKVFIGAQGMIGYYTPSINGQLAFTSLNELVPQKERDFADVWEVIALEDKVFFRSNKKIFLYQDDRITVFNSISWNFMGLSNGQLIADDYERGMLSFHKGRWIPFITEGRLPSQARITGLVSLSRQRSLLTTLKNGMFIIDNNRVSPFVCDANAVVADKNIYSALRIDEHTIAIGTSLGGCYLINENGEILQRLSKQDGLQNNNVLCIFSDSNRNIWLGLESGIDHIAYNNAIRKVLPDLSERSAGYAALVMDNNLYIGNSNGLFRASIGSEEEIAANRSAFRLVKGSKGQVWNLSAINNTVLMGHNEGFFQVKGNDAEVIDGTSGFWNFLALGAQYPATQLIAGTYNGINFYDYRNGRISNPSVHTHFESSRFVVIDNDMVWIAHPYKGLYKVKLDDLQHPKYSVYTDRQGILSKNHNHLFKLKSRLVLTNDNGLFEYNWKTDAFERSKLLSKFFPTPVQYLKEDDDGNIWFIEGKRLGLIDYGWRFPVKVYIPELDNKILSNGFEYVYPYDKHNIFVAAEEGFFVINYEKLRRSREKTPVLITSVRSINAGDSILFGGYPSSLQSSASSMTQQVPQVCYANNSLHFDYASPVYGQQTIEYSYLLEGFDKGWSNWSLKNEKEYTNLSPGNYVFKIRSRRFYGDESDVSSYEFHVLPPWYRTTLAYLFYILSATAIIWMLNRKQQRKFMKEKALHREEQSRMQYLHQLELEKNESEIIRLRNEKLEAELLLKEKELASTSMNLVQKDEMLGKVKEEFVKMKKDGVMDRTNEEYRKILRMLEESKQQDNWDQFAVHFDKVYTDFLVSLKQEFPRLTPSELKLCTYLRLNLSSKEISKIMNITIKSVELSRYRLRKKLQVESEVNLFDFLLHRGTPPWHGAVPRGRATV